MGFGIATGYPVTCERVKANLLNGTLMFSHSPMVNSDIARGIPVSLALYHEEQMWGGRWQ